MDEKRGRRLRRCCLLSSQKSELKYAIVADLPRVVVRFFDDRRTRGNVSSLGKLFKGI